jgi:hypothetical protein
MYLVLGFIAHKQAPNYRNRWGIQVNSGGQR